jgi:riboflavin synthase
MFTGIVQHQGVVVSLQREPWGARLVVAREGWTHAPAEGDSIAINGCCLTVVRTGSELAFDVVPQTLGLTTIGALQPGELVNLEHAATAGTLLGGHIVQGHVDGIGLVTGVDTSGGGWRTRIEAPAGAASLIVERGSVAVDGVSLTVAAVGSGWFEVALIPATLERTTLRQRLAGSRVNIEADCMARMVAEQVRRYLEAERRGG